jgi:pyruvyl transferase EpsO
VTGTAEAFSADHDALAGPWNVHRIINLAHAMHTEDGPATQSHLDVISRLQGLIDQALAPTLPTLKEAPYSLLDAPDYGNVGDSAIWVGTIAWLTTNVGWAPSFVCDFRDPLHEVNANLADGAILLQGGGNFGDIWPQFQHFREAVISTNSQRPIVQLPQSFHFGDPAALQRTARTLAKATQLRLLVRDQESLDLARAHFTSDVALCPDMAFAIGPLLRIGTQDLDVLLLLRTDKESRGFPAGRLPAGWEQADWLEDEPGLHRDVLHDTRVSALLSLDPRNWSKRARRYRYFHELARRRMQRGVRTLSRARFVITDRLHVHIIATLLGVPHCVLDNHYGKISRFSTAFSTRWRDSYQATTHSDAVACAREWLERTGTSRG